MNAFSRVVLVCLVTSIHALGDPPRGVEVWGAVGALNAASDEGSIGSGAAYGGGLTVPFSRTFAFEIDVQTMRAERFARVTRTLVSPAVVARFGSERAYGFAGGGIGLQSDSYPSFTENGHTYHGRGGVVFSPTGRLIFRAEGLLLWRYVAPTYGARFGVGYRF